MRKLGFIPLLLSSCFVFAEPRISTTANRLTAFIPWSVWYGGLAVFSLILCPCIISYLLRAAGVTKRRWLYGSVILGLVYGFLGFVLLEFIFVASIGYMNIHPMVFVISWLAAIIIMTAIYILFALRYDSKRKVV